MKKNEQTVGLPPREFKLPTALRTLILAFLVIGLTIVELVVITNAAQNAACSAAKENYVAASQQISNRLAVKIEALFSADESAFDKTGTLEGNLITVDGTTYSVADEAERINFAAGRAVICSLSDIVSGSSDSEVYIIIPKMTTNEEETEEEEGEEDDENSSEETENGSRAASDKDEEEDEVIPLYFYGLAQLQDELLTGAVGGFAVISGAGRIVWTDNASMEGYISDYSSYLPEKTLEVYISSGNPSMALCASKIGADYDYYVCVWDDFTARQATFSSLSGTVALICGLCGAVSVAAFVVLAMLQFSGEGGFKAKYHLETDANGKIVRSNKEFAQDFPKVIELKENIAYFDEQNYNVIVLKNPKDEDVTLACTVQHKPGKVQVNANVLSLPVGKDVLSAGENMRGAYEALHENGRRVMVGYAFIGNLDNFKKMFGEEFAELARKLVCAKLSEKFVFTYDEDFNTIGLLCRDGKELENLRQDMNDIVFYVNKTLPVEGNLVNPNVKFGFALVDSSMTDSSFLYAQKAANAALNRAVKDHDKDVYVYQEAQKKQYAKYFISYDIPKMLEENQFEMQYQPQYSIKEERIVGFEALFRVKENAIANANIFELITYAERTGSMILLSEFIFDTGMRFAKSIEGKGVAISLNVSPVQLMQAGFVDNFLKIYERYDLKPGSICVEITESFLMTTFDETVKKLNLLRDAGIEIHLDDFGTRYSSLLYLKKLPISTIKIDKEFIDDICNNEYSHAVTQMILNITKDIKCSNISEGVETMEQYNTLKEMGGDIVQGYLIGKALKSDVAAEMIDTFKLENS